MLTKKRKLGSKLDAGKPGNRLLRLFRSNDVFHGSLVSLENTDREDAYCEDPRTIRNVMLEFDYQNAKALQAFQRKERFQ